MLILFPVAQDDLERTPGLGKGIRYGADRGDQPNTYLRKLYANPSRDPQFASDVQAVADSICGYVR